MLFSRRSIIHSGYHPQLFWSFSQNAIIFYTFLSLSSCCYVYRNTRKLFHGFPPKREEDSPSIWNKSKVGRCRKEACGVLIISIKRKRCDARNEVWYVSQMESRAREKESGNWKRAVSLALSESSMIWNSHIVVGLYGAGPACWSLVEFVGSIDTQYYIYIYMYVSPYIYVYSGVLPL